MFLCSREKPHPPRTHQGTPCWHEKRSPVPPSVQPYRTAAFCFLVCMCLILNPRTVSACLGGACLASCRRAGVDGAYGSVGIDPSPCCLLAHRCFWWLMCFGRVWRSEHELKFRGGVCFCSSVNITSLIYMRKKTNPSKWSSTQDEVLWSCRTGFYETFTIKRLLICRHWFWCVVFFFSSGQLPSVGRLHQQGQ